MQNTVAQLKSRFPNRNIVIELTNICNLQCPLCSTGSGFNTNTKGMMNFDEYKKFIDICSPLIDTVTFSGSGEPFLHPRCLDFFNYAARKKKIVSCCTNGTVMKDFTAIVKSGLDIIHIDIDGLTQSQHQLYRKGSDLTIVLDNTRNLVRAKKKQFSLNPMIFADVLISKHNENDYSSFFRLAKELGVNGIHLKSISEDLFKTSDWFPLSEKFRHIDRQDNYECSFKDSLVGILSWNGEIQLCCMSPHHKNPVIKLNGFKEGGLLGLMNSNQFYSVTKKAGNYEFCRKCFFRKYISYSETKFTDSPTKLIVWGIIKAFKKSPYAVFKKAGEKLSRTVQNYIQHFKV